MAGFIGLTSMVNLSNFFSSLMDRLVMSQSYLALLLCGYRVATAIVCLILLELLHTAMLTPGQIDFLVWGGDILCTVAALNIGG